MSGTARWRTTAGSAAGRGRATRGPAGWLRVVVGLVAGAALLVSAGCGGLGVIAYDTVRASSLRDCDRLGSTDDRAECRRRIVQAETDARRAREAADRQPSSEDRGRAADDPTRDGTGRCFRRAATGELVCTGS